MQSCFIKVICDSNITPILSWAVAHSPGWESIFKNFRLVIFPFAISPEFHLLRTYALTYHLKFKALHSRTIKCNPHTSPKNQDRSLQSYRELHEFPLWLLCFSSASCFPISLSLLKLFLVSWCPASHFHYSQSYIIIQCLPQMLPSPRSQTRNKSFPPFLPPFIPSLLLMNTAVFPLLWIAHLKLWPIFLSGNSQSLSLYHVPQKSI